MSRKLTPEEVEKIVKSSRPFISLDYSTYIDRFSKARFIDSEYGEFWVTPGTLLYRKEAVHPARKNKILKEKNKWSKTADKNRKGLDSVLSKLPTHLKIVPETYKGTSIKCTFIDSDYGEFIARPVQVLKGLSKHPKRPKEGSSRWSTSKLSFKDLREKVSSSGAELIEDLGNSLKVKCKEGHVKEVKRSNFLRRDKYRQYECQDCGSNLVLTQAEVEKRYAEYGFKVLETYKDDRTPTLVECSKGHQFYYSMKSFSSNRGAPACNRCGGSGLEKEINNYIEELGFKTKIGVRNIIKPKEIDILVEGTNVAIEATGLYWHTDRTRPKEYHREKLIACQEANLRLLTIYQDEWRFKNKIVKSLLKYHLGVVNEKINARSCIIRELSYQESKCFLEENHLMGATTHRAYGLYHKEKLVSVLSYKNNGSNIEIVRFCSLADVLVRGAFGKLVKKLRTKFNSARIISWVDLRYGDGRSYESLGFKRVKTTLGWKWTDFIKTYNRLYCRANMDNRKLSQAEYAKELKLEKIYDCGQSLYALD